MVIESVCAHAKIYGWEKIHGHIDCKRGKRIKKIAHTLHVPFAKKICRFFFKFRIHTCCARACVRTNALSCFTLTVRYTSDACVCLCIESSFSIWAWCMWWMNNNLRPLLIAVGMRVDVSVQLLLIYFVRAREREYTSSRVMAYEVLLLLLLLLLYDILWLPRENYSRAEHILQLHHSNALRYMSVKPFTLFLFHSAHMCCVYEYAPTLLCCAVCCCTVLLWMARITVALTRIVKEKLEMVRWSSV